MIGDAISIRDDPNVDQSSWAFLDLIQQLKVWTHTVNPRVMPSSATVNPMDDLVLVTATATATLHTPVGFDGLWHTFVNTGAGTMTIASASNISGAATIATSRQWDCISVKSTGSTWVVLIRPGALTGDVTASGLTMNTARLLGRTTVGVGAVEEITVGAGLSLTAGTLTGTGGASYAQIATHTVGGTEATISFTGISSEDIIIYTNGLKGDGSDSLQVAVSIDNGSTYGTPRDISAGGTIGGTAIYGSAFATGLKCGHMVIVGGKPSTTAPGINSGANLSAVNNSLAQFTTAAQINALQFSQVAGSNFTLGTLSLLGR